MRRRPGRSIRRTTVFSARALARRYNHLGEQPALNPYAGVF